MGPEVHSFVVTSEHFQQKQSPGELQMLKSDIPNLDIPKPNLSSSVCFAAVIAKTQQCAAL